MKALFLFLFVLILLGFITLDKRTNNQGFENDKYTVLKIDSIDSVYIIYIERNDSTFKLFTQKECSENCMRIKVNEAYHFRLVSWFLPEEFYVKHHVAGTRYKGVVIPLERDTVVGDLFYSTNLRGLCIDEEL